MKNLILSILFSTVPGVIFAGINDNDKLDIVAIPECITGFKDFIETIALETNSSSLQEFSAAIQNSVTTYENLKMATNELCSILKDCSTPELSELKKDLTELKKLIDSQDKSLFVDTSKLYRKKCCCTSAGVFTTVTASSYIATTGGYLAVKGVKILSGSGAPTISAPKGSLYLNTSGSSTSTRAYINTDGGTTWTAITTAA